MRPGPVLAKRALVAKIEVTSAPAPLIDLIAEVCFENGWSGTVSEARELAERWASQVLTLMTQEYNELCRLGRPTSFAFNSSSTTYIQGSSFLEPGDVGAVRSAKTSRAQFSDYAAALAKLTPREFECLCVGILRVLGVDDAVLTPRSGDEGIDFYGRLRLEKHIFADQRLPGLQRQLVVWLVGQAKHYRTGKVSTPEIRDLVGAVQLARGRAFASGDEQKYSDLVVRVCDPVFYLFFTTGRLSADSWMLLERSGVIGMDGEMVSAFLADHSVGVADEKFNEAGFRRWLTDDGRLKC